MTTLRAGTPSALRGPVAGVGREGFRGLLEGWEQASVGVLGGLVEEELRRLHELLLVEAPPWRCATPAILEVSTTPAARWRCAEGARTSPRSFRSSWGRMGIDGWATLRLACEAVGLVQLRVEPVSSCKLRPAALPRPLLSGLGVSMLQPQRGAGSWGPVWAGDDVAAGRVGRGGRLCQGVAVRTTQPDPTSSVLPLKEPAMPGLGHRRARRLHDVTPRSRGPRATPRRLPGRDDAQVLGTPPKRHVSRIAGEELRPLRLAISCRPSPAKADSWRKLLLDVGVLTASRSGRPRGAGR